MPASGRPWVVCKFGGTSVSSRARWDTIVEVVRTHRAEGRAPFLVCSALQGISDQLEALCAQLASAEPGAPESTLDTIRERHRALGQDLGVEAEAVLSGEFARLERWVDEIQATDGPSPRQRAAVLATGELLSTRLGAAYLSAQGLPAEWLDAREFLRATDDPHLPPRRQYLAANCTSHADPGLQARLADAPETVYLTQGFIASNALDETVLLGRGGSDTSAAHFAAKLEAERTEVWTDVPGLFTANPGEVPSGRLLRRLDYDEAQELATMGARVLHPRCLDPARRHQIPLHVRSTEAPSLDGTIVSGEGPDVGPQVKAISAKTDITAVSMDTLGMWQEVGFLADVFQVFKHHGLSVDLMATSESNVTVTLDPVANALDPDILDRLLHDLNRYCDAELIDPCAIVSLVGRHIRSLLSELGPAFEVFDEQKVHLVTQAASDLNMSFVVDEDQASRLVRELHAQFFGHRAPDAVFGPRWQELVEDGTPEETPDVWWRERREALLRLADDESPRYVYDPEVVTARSDEVQGLGPIDQSFYAVKANPHPEVLRLLEQRGLGFECVSPGELDRVFEACPGLDPARVLFQPNFAAPAEYADAFERGVHVTVDNVQPLAEHPDVFAGEELFVRVDPGQGEGHHRKVRTAGAQSKFGVVPDDLGRLRAAVDQAGATVVGLHAHVGSGITDESTWAGLVDLLASLAAEFPAARALNVGGGLGVPNASGGRPLDLDALDAALGEAAARHPQYDLWMEPGRYLVAEAGVLLARVTQTKTKDAAAYVGLDTGMNSLLRPALYGAHHEIVNLSRLDEPPAMTADVVGPVCETGDVLGHDRRLPPTEPGDTLLVATTGAYGASMSNRYNLREPASEVMLAPEPA
ncbi:bifunctional aspartate kinase/diaminopimelate decarboxylase [Salinibacter ruber]|uniref:Diaminopimelate decarboxylase n=2 Tax=Salinibacter ruber TaxID=146919 RepID=A0A9X2U0M3_9BACT|nr:bifunctional aspartate kinase/diaminopimelate decarboxylase [Salinibacter ruber]MBB4090714.1 diaminopimelate decarboxylase/aspartate kinase [Salinibacter ruber]MCS3615973.1 diaminopimelate decarboxylase/aspartate kinase [Salinibacter ruber]MCS3784819.1 diaminopimelate decarboxylase/aspartate kinase [Salinibacter ruber]MCS3857472.1 diaminopimelate decarboxylase/aspartate kinase [Salinibacter ruber]MCS3864298.1 diaminopimelate decarboxylase/aspartate kinase [Salinibacter ruber]